MPDLVATGLKRGRTMTIGMIVSDLANPFNAELIRGVSRTMEPEGLVTLVAETGEDRERFERLLRLFVQRRCDAVVLSAAHDDYLEGIERIARGSVPIVLATRNLPGGELGFVHHDDHGAGRVAAAHLLELGHITTAQLHGPGEISIFRDRALGFAQTATAGGARDVSLDERCAGLSLAEGRRVAALTLAGEERPTALFAPSDIVAIGALEAIAAAGLSCPRDVSVVGCGDVEWSAYVRPALTTVELPIEPLGQAAGAMVVELLGDPLRRPEVVELPVSLTVRDSTAAPRA